MVMVVAVLVVGVGVGVVDELNATIAFNLSPRCCNCHDTTKPLSLIPILVTLILSWTPRGPTCLPRGTAQIALLSIVIYFLFSACLACDLRNRLPRIAIGLRP